MGKRLIGSVGLKPGTDTGFDLDEKGQIHTYSDTQFALPVGDDNQILSSLASEASGLKWIASTGALWSVLGTYEASSAEASKTFTFTAVDFDDDSVLFLEIDGGASASTNTLEIQVDGDTSASYDGQTIQMLQGTQTLADITNQTSAVIAPASLFAEGNEGFFSTVWIGLHKAGNQDRPMINASTVLPSQRGSLQYFGCCDTALDDLESVTILSQANWQIGTRMTLYKVARA
jgi:hypothetical protein|tara:strand:- start:198 stop:893 length:696 start_codon:yes stop_codon:yes gene_type:complete